MSGSAFQDWRKRKFGEFADGAPIRLDGVFGGLDAPALGHSAFASGEDQAGGEAFEIPFPRTGDGLVEIIYVHDDVTVRRPVQAEVRRMRVTAQLRCQSGDRSSGEVGSHQTGGAAEEGERRGDHPTDPQWDEMCQPALVVGLDEVEHIRSVGAGRGVIVCTGRHGCLQRVPTRDDVVRVILGSQVHGARSILRHHGDTIGGICAA